MKQPVLPLALLLGATLASSSLSAQEDDKWFTRPYIGVSQLSDLNGSFSNVDNLFGTADITLDSGFVAGWGIGYQYTSEFAVEFAWEYRSNDSSVDLMGQSQFESGNYASNTFFLNASYEFTGDSQWQPYIGGGISWIQEVDIDLERNNSELSYSGDGEVGYQLFAGVNYRLSQQWLFQSEVRYGITNDIQLDGEEGAIGQFSDLEYKPLTLQFGLVYRF